MKTYILDNQKKLDASTSKLLSTGQVELVHESKFLDTLIKSQDKSLWITNDVKLIVNSLNHADKKIFMNQTFMKKLANIIYLVSRSSLDPFSSSVFLTLESLFKLAIPLAREFSLPFKELIVVTSLKNASEYVIGASLDFEVNIINLVRGDLSRMAIPFSAFPVSGDGISPNFEDFSIIDYGQTLKFGDYEASVDAVLYEFDPIYRKRLQSSLAEQDKSLGACLRRLRNQKRLKQSDFPGIDPKVIGRIERGEVEKPRNATLNIICQVTGVSSVNELMSF